MPKTETPDGTVFETGIDKAYGAYGERFWNCISVRA